MLEQLQLARRTNGGDAGGERKAADERASLPERRLGARGRAEFLVFVFGVGKICIRGVMCVRAADEESGGRRRAGLVVGEGGARRRLVSCEEGRWRWSSRQAPLLNQHVLLAEGADSAMRRSDKLAVGADSRSEKASLLNY